MHLIDVRDVYKIYNPGENQVNALDGVSLTIDEGEFVAIIGQSGSGKSTLMNMLGLLDVPTSGEYYINGNLVEDLILHRLKDEGRTVVVITHDNEIAMEAERVVRIRDGKIVEDYINPGFEEKYGRESKKDNANPIDQG